MIYLLVMYIYNHSSMLQKPDVWQIMASSMVDPALIFLCPIQICPPPPSQHHFKEKYSFKSNADFV